MDGTTPACLQTNACALADDLLDVSAVTVCQVGVGGCTQASQVTGLASPTSFQNGATSIVGQVQSKEGWYTTLVRSRERVIANPIVLGGVVFFPSFVPDNDVCSTSGDSYLFALFYKSGSAYQDPVIGATAGINNKSVYLDRGVSSSVAIHIGSQGPGGNPSAVQGCIQASSAAISCVSMSPPGSVSSRYITWSRQRD
jgi:type IV pilus assembly protein PilY1